MAVILDERVRAALTRRRDKGHAAAITLTVIKPRCMPPMLKVRWGTPRAWERSVRGWDSERLTPLYLGPRVARYAAENDLMLTIPHLGPLAHLMVACEAMVVLELEDWEARHVPYTQNIS